MLEGTAMINVAAHIPVFLATRPVDFRKGMESLAAFVEVECDLRAYSGAVFVFRNRGATSVKVLHWDGTGLILVTKRLEDGRFVWPSVRDGTMKLSRSQFEALFEGLDWSRVRPREVRQPVVAA